MHNQSKPQIAHLCIIVITRDGQFQITLVGLPIGLITVTNYLPHCFYIMAHLKLIYSMFIEG